MGKSTGSRTSAEQQVRGIKPVDDFRNGYANL